MIGQDPEECGTVGHPEFKVASAQNDKEATAELQRHGAKTGNKGFDNRTQAAKARFCETIDINKELEHAAEMLATDAPNSRGNGTKGTMRKMFMGLTHKGVKGDNQHVFGQVETHADGMDFFCSSKSTCRPCTRHNSPT